MPNVVDCYLCGPDLLNLPVLFLLALVGFGAGRSRDRVIFFSLAAVPPTIWFLDGFLSGITAAGALLVGALVGLGLVFYRNRSRTGKAA